MFSMVLFFYGYGDHRDLHVLTHSFPTRRSSDLLALAILTSCSASGERDERASTASHWDCLRRRAVPFRPVAVAAAAEGVEQSHNAASLIAQKGGKCSMGRKCLMAKCTDWRLFKSGAEEELNWEFKGDGKLQIGNA